MKKEFPFKKVLNKLDSLDTQQEELERQVEFNSSPLWRLEDRVLAIQLAIELATEQGN